MNMRPTSLECSDCAAAGISSRCIAAPVAGKYSSLIESNEGIPRELFYLYIPFLLLLFKVFQAFVLNFPIPDRRNCVSNRVPTPINNALISGIDIHRP